MDDDNYNVTNKSLTVLPNTAEYGERTPLDTAPPPLDCYQLPHLVHVHRHRSDDYRIYVVLSTKHDHHTTTTISAAAATII
jgi:hypothetical protein